MGAVNKMMSRSFTIALVLCAVCAAMSAPTYDEVVPESQKAPFGLGGAAEQAQWAKETAPSPENGEAFQRLKNEVERAQARALDTKNDEETSQKEGNTLKVEVDKKELEALATQVKADTDYLTSFQKEHASEIEKMKTQNM